MIDGLQSLCNPKVDGLMYCDVCHAVSPLQGKRTVGLGLSPQHLIQEKKVVRDTCTPAGCSMSVRNLALDTTG